MSPSAVDIADRLREIARTLQRIDHPLADWFDESVRPALLGVPLSEALGWSHGYEARVRQRRLARDQEPDANGALVDTDAVQRAYSDLCQHLDGNNDSKALSLLKHLMNALTGDGAMDDPMPFSGRPTPAMDSARRVAANARAGKAQAQQFLFDRKFPGAARIRVVG